MRPLRVEPETSYDLKIFDNIANGTMITKYRAILYCLDADMNHLGRATNSTADNENSWSPAFSKKFTTLANTKYCYLQIYTSVLSYSQIWFGKTENLPEVYEPAYYLPFVRESDVEGLVTQKEMEAYVAEQIELNGGGGGGSIGGGDVTIETGASKYEWFLANENKSADDIYKRLANTAKVCKELDETEFSLLREGDVYQHDAVIRYYNNHVYVFYVNNQVDNGDSAGNVNAYVRLDKLAVNSSTGNITELVETYDVSRNGDTVDDLTVLSGTGVPNMVLVGDTLYMLFSFRGDDKYWYEAYCTYDCANGVLGTPHICTLDGDTFACHKLGAKAGQPSANNMISVNASIAYLDGYYYAIACCYEQFTNGILIRSANLMDWEFVTVPTFEGYTPAAQFEGALGALGGYLYLAMRQTTQDAATLVNPIILAKLDTTGAVLDYALLPGAASRPSFYNKGTTELYLICPSGGRTTAMSLRVESSGLRRTWPLFDFVNRGNYTQCCAKSTSVFYTVRTNGSIGLRVGKYTHSFSASITDLVT